MKRILGIIIIAILPVTFTAMLLSCKRLTLATLVTASVYNITQTSAVSGGNISSDGGGALIERGVCWAIHQNPTIDNERTLDGTGSGSFESNIKCLSFATTYYVRAYATNNAGTAYGDQVSFTTQGTNPIIFNPDLTYGSVTDIDGNCYKTIQIGTQTWMAENLRTSKYNDGALIPEITNTNEWSNLCYPVQNEFGSWINGGTGAFCWYNNYQTYDNLYGKLYNWMAVQTIKLCPAGWHIPTLGEWENLIDFTNINPFEPTGEYLMEIGTTHWDASLHLFSIGVISTNETGFTAVPGGLRASDGVFRDIGFISIFWASDTRFPTDWAYKLQIPYQTTSSPSLASAQVGSGLSVRCIKD